MYKYFLFLILVLAPILSIHGQNDSMAFGKITRYEIGLKSYLPDPKADAVVLLDIGKSYFVESRTSFDIVFERTTRIKVFTEAGLKWAEIQIPYYHENGINETIYDIQANTYNNQNEFAYNTTFNSTNSFDEKINDLWSVKKFAIPNVKAGTIFEYTYKINTPYKFNLRDWEFQWQIPVAHSEYELKMIPFFEYSYLMQGANKFDLNATYEDKSNPRRYGSGAYENNTYFDLVHKLAMKNVPAFKDEEFITSKEDYIIRIDFQLSKINYLDGRVVNIMTTWEDMSTELLKNPDFGKYVEKSERLASSQLDLTSLAKKSKLDKFNYILDFVKRNFNWNEHSGKYATKSPTQFAEDKFGNCAEINLFTIGLLKSAGIEAHPLLISTRENGKIKYDYPYTHFFDYVLIAATLDSFIVLGDATESLLQNNRIPPRCINDKGLVIRKGAPEWLSLGCLFSSELNIDIQMQLIDDNMLEVNVQNISTEYDALRYRNHYTTNTDHFKKYLSTDEFEIIDSTLLVNNALEKDKSFEVRYTMTGHPEIINNKIYISPFLDESMSDNPLKQSTRTYPVDINYPKKRSLKSSITVPEGYHVEYLPDPLKYNNQLFALEYSVMKDAEQVMVKLDYHFKKSIYPAAEYGLVKTFFNDIVKKGNDKVVLSK